jgi:laminin alpha 3/5
MFNCRDQLSEQLPKSVMFGGNGYIILAKGNFKPAQQSAVRFKFRTFVPNGLMFFMSQKPDFFSIELREGKVVARYDLGSGPALLQSSESYNDGKWHSLYMNRVRNDGILKIDDSTGIDIGFILILIPNCFYTCMWRIGCDRQPHSEQSV